MSGTEPRESACSPLPPHTSHHSLCNPFTAPSTPALLYCYLHSVYRRIYLNMHGFPSATPTRNECQWKCCTIQCNWTRKWIFTPHPSSIYFFLCIIPSSSCNHTAFMSLCGTIAWLGLPLCSFSLCLWLPGRVSQVQGRPTDLHILVYVFPFSYEARDGQHID